MMHRSLTDQAIPEAKTISAWMFVRFPDIVPVNLPGFPVGLMYCGVHGGVRSIGISNA